MILSKLTKFAWTIFVLALTTGTLSAQRGNGRNAALNGQNSVCLNQISGLSTDQADKISALRDEHQQEISLLRNERRSQTDFSKKDEIRLEMLGMIEEHRSEVKSLLNADQQMEFDAIQRSGNFNSNQGNRFLQRNKGNSTNQQGINGNYNGSNWGRNRCY